MEPIRLEITLTLDDVREMVRTDRRITPFFKLYGRLLIVFAILFAIVIGVVVFNVLQGNASPFMLVFWPAFLCAYAVLILWLQRPTRLAKVLRKRQPELALPIAYEVSDDCVRVVTSGADVRFRWQAVAKFAEGKNILALEVQPRKYLTIPKRACKDDAQLQALRDLINAHLGDRNEAFRVLPVEPVERPGIGE